MPYKLNGMPLYIKHALLKQTNTVPADPLSKWMSSFPHFFLIRFFAFALGKHIFNDVSASFFIYV